MENMLTKVAVAAGLYLVLSAGCASQLKPYKKINTPTGSGVEEELDLSTIYFHDIQSTVRFSVLDYMNQNGKDHLLLMFGSKGCTACNLKNEEFKKSIIGQHDLFLDQAGKKFDLIGVNTDIESADRMRAYLTNFDFIRWSDPKGLAMIANFIPPGRSFGVPVTVLLNKRGVVFRLLNDEKATPEQIMTRVERAINGSNSNGDGSDDGDDGTSEGGDDGSVVPIPVIPATDLAFVGPGRFKKINMTSCDGTPTDLDSVLGQPDFRIVHVTKNNCDVACRANLEQVQAVEKSLCNEAGAVADSKKCAVAALQTGDGALDVDSCVTGLVYKGGEKFLEVFESHFNWSYPVFEDPTDFEPRFAKSFDGPLTMVFRRDGTLVWSAEGQMTPQALMAALNSPSFGLEVVKGPDFPVYTSEKVVKNFSEIRRQSKLTVVVSTLIFDTIGCGSCELELAHWSKPNGFFDYCAARPTDCQIMLFDFRDVRNLVPMSTFYDLIKNGGMDPEFNVQIKGLIERQIRIPLFLDPLPHSLEDGSINFNRHYEGYLKAASRELGPVGRVAIYNNEGSILTIHASGQDVEPTDDIFNFVKANLGQQ